MLRVLIIILLTLLQSFFIFCLCFGEGDRLPEWLSISLNYEPVVSSLQVEISLVDSEDQMAL